MRCDRCGRENGPDAQFCAQCGAPVAAAPVKRLAVTLTPDQISAPAGRATVARLEARNVGTLVEHVRIVLDGAAARWTTVDPGMLPVMPTESALAVVTVTPPRTAAAAAGHHALILQLQAEGDGAVLGRADALVTVAPFAALTGRIVPHELTRWRGGNATLELTSGGNEAITAAITATDDDEALVFSGLPASVTVAPGATVRLPFRAAARGWHVTGQIAPHAFAATVTTADGTAVKVPGTLRQRALITPLTIVLALLALGLLTVMVNTLR